MLHNALTLWWMGVREALAVHRCVVFLVLDESTTKAVLHCFILNGAILLGSILAWDYGLQPAVGWLLRVLVAPVLGGAVAGGGSWLLAAAVQALWLAPVYLVTMLVSCGIYNDVAKHAYMIKTKQAGSGGASSKAAGAGSNGSGAGSGVGSGASGGAGGGGGLEDAAQELYRVVLFCIFFAEVSVVGKVPYAGYFLNVLALSWLYAYYCFDYKWGLQGVRLTERLAYFERRWAFFAGFGLPMALSTVLLSFYPGAAVLAVLFPVYILVACDCDVNAAHDRVIGAGGAAQLRPLPIFALALWPTQYVVQLITGSGRSRGASGAEKRTGAGIRSGTGAVGPDGPHGGVAHAYR
ncbi:hypothetical protein HYH02_005715 [Chlamydomonas schloesseri]|uniref:Uncharacterized protein n=1 Tax=Chlamydomonas schloesseri TaxID=2026947 RepID=A0A835WK91_9CHLO|nr:hypothetical protein HYH02_005715 [Chlamydomonas schloesseri]|eukprot:KAG2448961.1 hypothetical protein HYH02_005715 [Chlamydomonas schloesseri]